METPEPDNHTMLPSLPDRSRKLLASRSGLFPVISHVCREARNSVLKHHGTVYLPGEDATQTDHEGKPYPPWGYWDETSPMRLRKGVDIVHLHWHPKYDQHAYLPPVPDPFPSFQWLANQGGAASVSAELLHPFESYPNLELGLDSYFEHDPLGDGDYDYARYFRPHTRSYVVLAIVEMHMSGDEAVQSDVFGMLGEEPIKLVDPRDTVAVARFQDAWRRYRLPLEEPNVASFFSRAINSEAYGERVEQWCMELEKQWMWYKTKVTGVGDDAQGEIWLGQDRPRWRPPFGWPSRGIDWMNRELNREHPWMQEQMGLMPRFELVVMFRYCSNMCGLHTLVSRE